MSIQASLKELFPCSTTLNDAIHQARRWFVCRQKPLNLTFEVFCNVGSAQRALKSHFSRRCDAMMAGARQPNMLCLSEIFHPSGHIREIPHLHSFTFCGDGVLRVGWWISRQFIRWWAGRVTLGRHEKEFRRCSLLLHFWQLAFWQLTAAARVRPPSDFINRNFLPFVTRCC